jgi:hypothetical protein
LVYLDELKEKRNNGPNDRSGPKHPASGLFKLTNSVIEAAYFLVVDGHGSDQGIHLALKPPESQEKFFVHCDFS